jgi:hypothetical protein
MGAGAHASCGAVAPGPACSRRAPSAEREAQLIGDAVEHDPRYRQPGGGLDEERLEDKRFAATVDRAEVAAGAKLLGVSLDDRLGFVIDALRPHAAELGLLGRGAPGLIDRGSGATLRLPLPGDPARPGKVVLRVT